MQENSRRRFLQNSLMALMAVPLLRWTSDGGATVTLEGRAEQLANEVVSFGLPLPFGFLHEAQKVRVVDERGVELPVAVRPLEPWRIGGREGSIRSVLIQFKADFSKQKTQRVRVSFDARTRAPRSEFVPVSQRVVAVLPADWLCASGIVGPQIPTTESGAYASYDRFVEKNFPGSLKYLDSQVYHEWLFDRTTCYYKMYVRTGDRQFLDPVYRAGLLKPVQLGVDPERGRNFWTLRHQGYGLLGILHGWEMTGEQKYWTKARECVDAYYKHQQQPPDGHPPDGSLRQNWELYDPNEATFPGATSAWMMALLLDPLFHYWTLTHDRRIAEMVVKWCDFLDRQGIVPDGSKAYYVINCFATKEPRGELGPDMEMHNTEMAYMFALGLFFTKDARRKEIYQKRLKHFLDLAVQLDMNRPARAFNWAFQFTSQLVYFAQHQGEGLRG